MHWMVTYTCVRFVMWSVTSYVIMNNGNAFPMHAPPFKSGMHCVSFVRSSSAIPCTLSAVADGQPS